MIGRPALAAACVLLFWGCSPEPAVDAAAETATLVAAADAYHAAASAKDAQSVVAFYDDDAIMVPPGALPVMGIEAVREYRFGFIETPGVELDFELVRAEVSSAADMGWTLAVGDITIHREDGPPGRDRVRDFHTWRRQPDGSWKVVVDIWNSAPVEEGADASATGGAG